MSKRIAHFPLRFLCEESVNDGQRRADADRLQAPLPRQRLTSRHMCGTHRLRALDGAAAIASGVGAHHRAHHRNPAEADRRRLHVSLVVSRFDAGKVRKEHIASLGSVETPLTVAGRVGFWQQLNSRLARLDNRLDAAAQCVAAPVRQPARNPDNGSVGPARGAP
jgi:hypothetical protein